MKKEDVIQSLRICDVDTICIGFESSDLQHLYWEFMGKKAPSTYSDKRIATEIKGVIDLVDKAKQNVAELGITSVSDVCELLDDVSPEELDRAYSRQELYTIYVAVYEGKPLSVWSSLDMAQALVQYVKAQKRANALLGG